MRDEYTHALTAEILALERTLSDLVNQAYGLTPAEIALMWQTAPPCMPILPPATLSGLPQPRLSEVTGLPPVQSGARLPVELRLSTGSVALFPGWEGKLLSWQ